MHHPLEAHTRRNVVVVLLVVELHLHEQLENGLGFDCITIHLLFDAVELDAEVHVRETLQSAIVKVTLLNVIVDEVDRHVLMILLVVVKLGEVIITAVDVHQLTVSVLALLPKVDAGQHRKPDVVGEDKSQRDPSKHVEPGCPDGISTADKIVHHELNEVE